MKDFFNYYGRVFKECSLGSVDVISSLYNEDYFEGYPNTPGGSAWQSELKFLYCCLRLIKPKKIIEIGNWKGHSTNHILLALDKNNIDYSLDLVDIEENLLYDNLFNSKFNRHLCDSIEFIKSDKYQSYDFIVQDGNHDYEYVKEELSLFLEKNKKPFYIWSHDYYAGKTGVKKAWDEMADKFDKFYPLIDDVSNCGIVFAYKGI